MFYILYCYRLSVLSVLWHHSLLLMNSFNKTEAAVFSCRLCFLRAFPFISLLLLKLNLYFKHISGNYPGGWKWHILGRRFTRYTKNTLCQICLVNKQCMYNHTFHTNWLVQDCSLPVRVCLPLMRMSDRTDQVRFRCYARINKKTKWRHKIEHETQEKTGFYH